MNERIKELAEQATDDILGVHVLDKEKFAKLMVTECADFVQFYYRDHACEGIAHDMKTHFGVK